AENTWTQNEPSFSSTSHSEYEVIYRSESGSGRSSSLCSLEHRRHRSRAERTWNRRAELHELARVRQFSVRAQRKRREPTSRPILTTVAAGVSPAFPSQPTRLPPQNHTTRDLILAKSRSLRDA